MPRELTLIKWCDICWADATRQVSVESYDLIVNGAALTLDVCAEHKDPLLSQVLTHGVTASRRPEAKQLGKPLACPVPGCVVTATSPRGLNVHVSRSHRDISMDGRRALLGYDNRGRRVAP